MASRTAYGLGLSIMLAAACAGEPFTGAGESGGMSGSGAVDGRAGDGGQASAGGPVDSAGGEAGGAGEPSVARCESATECPQSSQCVRAICSGGECSEERLPDGPFMLQVPGDCQQARCEGGKEVLVTDVTDADDMGECTTDACDANGTPTHIPRVGAECAAGGLCSPAGKCETCDRSQCPAADACHVPYCSGGQCQLALRPPGTVCGSDAPADARQCDERGTCVDCFDEAGCLAALTCTAQHTCGLN